MAPSVSSGYFADNQGEISTVYGGDTPIVKQSTSELRTGIFSDDVIGKNLQKQKQEAQSTMQSVQETYSNNVSNSTRLMSDYMTHLAGSTNYSENQSEREGYGIQSSISHIQGIAENWGQKYGLSARESTDVLLGASVSAGLDWKVISARANLGGNLGRNISRDEMLDSALSVSKSEGFQQCLQKIQDYAKSKSFNSGHDEGYRWSDNMCDAFDKLSSSQESYQKAKNHLEQVSENTSWFEQNSQMIKSSLNQDFIKWSSQEYESSGGFDRVKEILSENSACDIQPLIQKFIHHTREEVGLPQSISDVNYQIQGFESDFESIKHKVTEEDKSRGDRVLSTIRANKSIETFNDLYKDILSQRFSDIKLNQETGTEVIKEKLDTQRESANEDFDLANSKYLIERCWQGLNKSVDLGDNCRIVEEPFWHNEKGQ